ncbi:hypothetical protein CLU79DRAFT_714313 [Phycomyces nitens]|nr:hypothetical protein CLU79DRAFT_714313 [Phycomyces nitens]
MNEAGINIKTYGAHSLWSASITKAVLKETSIQSVKLHANWSLNSDTFERYYFKPADQHAQGSDIAEKLFGEVTENETTSKVRVEPTAIVLGMTHNGNVGETKTEDVVATHPSLMWKEYFKGLF